MLQQKNIRLCKIFTFEMAHALLDYDGACRNIHGHSYKLFVTVIGIPVQKEGEPKDGMLMDFKVLKKIVKENIINLLDHALVLNERTPKEVVDTLKGMYDKVITKPFQPTCELMLIEMVDLITPLLPQGVKLHQLKLYETETSYAEWCKDDEEVLL